MLKYVVPERGFPTLYFGIANVVANGLIMLRYRKFVPWPFHVPILTIVTVLLFYGYPRIWKTITPTIWPCDVPCSTSVFSGSRRGMGVGVAGLYA